MERIGDQVGVSWEQPAELFGVLGSPAEKAPVISFRLERQQRRGGLILVRHIGKHRNYVSRKKTRVCAPF